MKMILGLLLATVTATNLWADDWEVKGKTYHNVQVQGSDDAYVSVMYDGGIGRIALADLPPELQKKFNYDPSKAQAVLTAEQQRIAASDALVAAELAKEKAAKAAVAPTPASYTPAPQPSNAPSPFASTLTPEQRASIQEQINALQADIAEKQRIASEDAGHWDHLDGRKISQGGYEEKIREDQQQVAQLQAQLH